MKLINVVFTLAHSRQYNYYAEAYLEYHNISVFEWPSFTNYMDTAWSVHCQNGRIDRCPTEANKMTNTTSKKRKTRKVLLVRSLGLGLVREDQRRQCWICDLQRLRNDLQTRQPQARRFQHAPTRPKSTTAGLPVQPNRVLLTVSSSNTLFHAYTQQSVTPSQ